MRLTTHYYAPGQAVGRKRLIHNTTVVFPYHSHLSCYDDPQPILTLPYATLSYSVLTPTYPNPHTTLQYPPPPPLPHCA